jgi:hypothetical protein
VPIAIISAPTAASHGKNTDAPVAANVGVVGAAAPELPLVGDDPEVPAAATEAAAVVVVVVPDDGAVVVVVVVEPAATAVKLTVT